MVIHGDVDGFTRIPVFLHCSTNNKAATVLKMFLNAVENYEKYLFSLHYVFVPKINKHLNIWKDGWVNHKLSSEAQYTPLHLFISRMLDDDYQNSIFQENVLVSYKSQLIIFTCFLETLPTY